MPFYKIYQPSEKLKGLVRNFQLYHANWNEEKNLPRPFITCLANTEQNLYFYLGDEVKLVPAMDVEISIPKMVVTGPKYKPVGLLFGQDHLMLEISFQPTGTYRFLGIEMPPLTNKGIDAISIWGDEIQDLYLSMKGAKGYDQVISMAIDFLEKRSLRCRPEQPIDTVAIEMKDPNNDRALEEWAERSCLSLRQFERNFLSRVGLPPKLFIRIVRFEHAMKIKTEAPSRTWSEIAMECGYTDSSHMLREFREFAEFPPGKFFESPTSGFSEFPTA